MEANRYATFGQVSSEDAGQIFRDHLRAFVRQMIIEVMAAEVSELCGPKHQPSNSNHFRAGSSRGRVLLEGDREDVTRPTSRACVRSTRMAVARKLFLRRTKNRGQATHRMPAVEISAGFPNFCE